MVIGIVAEWNPFHEGHAGLIRKARAALPGAPVVCVMSGAFVQRGEPAIFDKWSRARWAVLGGVDLAVELPVLCVLQSADRFAAFGVQLLAGLGVTHLAFGTESLGREGIRAIAGWTLTNAFHQTLHEELERGIPYSRAVNLAIGRKFPSYAPDLERPNNLLGIQYARTILGQQLPMEILPIRRDTERPISATQIRQDMTPGAPPLHMPRAQKEAVAALLQRGAYTDYRRYDDACLLFLRTMEKKQLTDSGLFTEGLENRWYKEMGAPTYEALLNAVKSKRYLYSRLRRIGAALLLAGRMTPSPFSSPSMPSYARLLAMRASASSLLHETDLPVITSFAKALRTLPPAIRLPLELEERATDIQAWCMKGETARAARSDFYQSPVVIKDEE